MSQGMRLPAQSRVVLLATLLVVLGSRVRIRVAGEAPKVTVWFNDVLVNEQQDTANHAPLGMVEGPIVLQIHGGTDRWVPGGFWRWRNIGIKELPN